MNLSKAPWARLATVALLLALALPVAANVTSKSVTITPLAGVPMIIPISIQSTSDVAAVVGQINYDPATFSNPRLFLGPASAYFTTMGNLIAPGQYRFILFSEPTSIILTHMTNLQVILDANPVLPKSGSQTISYTFQSAASPTGESLNINLASVQVVFQRNTAESEWMLYE